MHRDEEIQGAGTAGADGGKGETEGIALISQYNGHGIFIAMEELGYIIMGLSFLFLTPVFNRINRLERTIRWCFPAPFILLIFAVVLQRF